MVGSRRSAYGLRLASLPPVLLAFLLCGAKAEAQIAISGYSNIAAQRQEQVSEKHFVLSGAVELERGTTKLYADTVEFFEDQDKVVASGNVVFSDGPNRIAADSAEFNTKTSLGTFFHASGVAPLQARQQRSTGLAVPQASGLDSDVYFFGEVVEKLGVQKYRITNGGFTTCLQPTARWDLSADTIVLNIDHYTLLRQAVMKVKGVPILYLPVMYFPTQEDGRATGFLIPTYGSSKRRGHNISTPFFWAINRSMDATFTHDWYSKTGSGLGAEYRYTLGGGSDGNITAYRLDEREASYLTDSGTVTTPASKYFTFTGNATHVFPGRIYARARANYFSSIVTNQNFNVDINRAASTTRSYGANLVGSWNSYSLNGTFDTAENFGTLSSSAVTGSAPRLTISRNERPLYKDARIYFSTSGEVAHLIRQTKVDDVVTDDRSLSRFDIFPSVRYPFNRWQWFTMNTAASWRSTYYTRSLTEATETTAATIVDEGIGRNYFTIGTRAVGPVLTRVFDTPGNGYAERFKHSIEPYTEIQRTSAIDVRDRIVQLDSSDSPYGNTTTVRYGVSNRLYAKRRIGATSLAQEIVSLDIGQSFYSDPRQALYDTSYATSYGGGTASSFSPVSVNLRATPTQSFTTTLQGEIDNRYYELRTLSANGSYSWSQRLQMSAGWSRKFFIKELNGYNDPASLSHYLNVSGSARTPDSRYGVNGSMNIDLLNSLVTQQRISVYYNAQCCGIAMEFQRYNYPGRQIGLPSDTRFFLSFSLAGLGNFSPLNGGLAGTR